MIRLRSLLFAVLCAGAATGCVKHFEFARYTTGDQMYRAALTELNEGSARVAAEGFDRVTNLLGQRDTLLPRAYWYLGMAHMKDREWQSAANAFRRIHALFSTDTLADDALLAAARASRQLWRNPELDSSYGEDARDLLTTLVQTYPLSPLREQVFAELDALAEMFATKDYVAAQDYYRDKAWRGAEKYAQAVIEGYPATNTAKRARILLVNVYKKGLKWAPEAEEQCKVMRDLYRDDSDVKELCGPPPPRRDTLPG